jgi:hypothetical protein
MLMNCSKQDKQPAAGDKISTADEHERLRRQLLEMIRRNEEDRRLKSK